MLKTVGAFLFGVYIGQEYRHQIPNIKENAIRLYLEFQKTVETESRKIKDEKLNKK